MSVVRLDSLARAPIPGTEADLGQPLRRTIPPMLVSEFLRVYDIAAIAAAGVLGYIVYVLPGPKDLDNRYPGSLILGSLVAAIMCHVFGAYKAESVFSRWLGARRAISGWLIAFAIILTAAFGLKMTESYSRVWAGAWLTSA